MFATALVPPLLFGERPTFVSLLTLVAAVRLLGLIVITVSGLSAFGSDLSQCATWHVCTRVRLFLCSHPQGEQLVILLTARRMAGLDPNVRIHV